MQQDREQHIRQQERIGAVDCLHLKVDAHGADEGWGEGVISIAEEEGSFADTAVANDEQFEHVVKILVRSIFDSGFTISH